MASSIPRTVNAPSEQWGADTYAVNDDKTSVQVSPADPERRSVTVWNDADSAGVLMIVSQQGVRRGGFRLIPGAGFEFITAAPIYAYAVGGDCTVNVVAQSGASC